MLNTNTSYKSYARELSESLYKEIFETSVNLAEEYKKYYIPEYRSFSAYLTGKLQFSDSLAESLSRLDLAAVNIFHCEFSYQSLAKAILESTTPHEISNLLSCV